MKKRLSQEHEYQFFLLVVDKVLWLGFGIMGFGLYRMLSATEVIEGIYFLIAGIVLLILLVWLIIKEFHFGSR